MTSATNAERYVNNAVNSLETMESVNQSVEVRKYLDGNLHLHSFNLSGIYKFSHGTLILAFMENCNVRVTGAKEFSSFFNFLLPKLSHIADDVFIY